MDGRNQSKGQVKRWDGTEKIAELTEHGRVQPINEGNEDRRRHDDQENVTKQEVRAPKRHLHNLDYVFTGRL